MTKEPEFAVPQSILVDSKDYFAKVEEFLAGEIDPVRFKGHRVPMGIYGQRSNEQENEKYMVRVRIPGGVLTREQLEVLTELSEEYGAAYLHFTTRQDIQIHQVDIEATPEILQKLLEVNLTPRGGGGNTVRNIMNSSRAGVNPEDVFDTTPHALALTEYLVRDRSSFNLPRKYKIAFSTSSFDEALATVNDLGFIAKEKNGQRGFKVYVAGGMGNEPEIAFLLDEFIAEDKIFHVAEAIKRFFDDYGDRSNKHQARLRFVRKKLGKKEFIKRYQEYYQKVIKDNLDTVEIKKYKVDNNLEAENDIKLKNNFDYINAQQQQGYYSVDLRPITGDISAGEAKKLLKLLDERDLAVRTSNRQGLVIRNIKASKLSDLIDEIKDINQSLLQDYQSLLPIACKGASTCRLGLCLSPDLAIEINHRFFELDIELQQVLPRVYISGCPNSCGQHLIGQIGLAGKAKRYQGRLVPHYSLFLGGQIEEDNSSYGEELIDLPAKRIPDFFVALAEKLAADKNYQRAEFNQYLAKNRDEIINLAREFTTIPDYEIEPEIYQDWGSDEDFSLAGRGPGECGVGVMDIIKLDIDTAKDNYEQAKKEMADEQFYQAIVNAARALLIVRGVDTKKDRVILSSFKEEFIKEGLIDKNYQKLIDAAFDYKLGDIDSLFNYEKRIEELIVAVDRLFNSLNSKLEFELKAEQKDDSTTGEKEASKTDYLSDLRGVKCPMNFIKAKVKLAELDSGEILDLYLDDGEPIKNVPRSLKEEGHEVLKQKQTEEGYYKLKVKKG